jgi:CheY-like chemotaxis protein
MASWSPSARSLPSILGTQESKTDQKRFSKPLRERKTCLSPFPTAKPFANPSKPTNIDEHLEIRAQAFCPSGRRIVADESVRKRMLFVDDEAGIRLTLPRILAKRGFDITSAANVAEALSEIKAQSFDVLLSDLNLLQPNEGFDIVKAMRHHQPGCVNFILTGYPAIESALQAVEYEVAHYFTKPIDIEELVSTITQKLGRT